MVWGPAPALVWGPTCLLQHPIRAALRQSHDAGGEDAEAGVRYCVLSYYRSKTGGLGQPSLNSSRSGRLIPLPARQVALAGGSSCPGACSVHGTCNEELAR